MNLRDLVLSFTVFWGVWLLVPGLVDGWTTLLGLAGAIIYHHRQKHQKPAALKFTPLVSVIIPVLNGEETIGACIDSIGRQDYPLDKIEVIVVDNGSTDRTREVVMQAANRVQCRVSYQAIVGRGKPYALNAGIHISSGQYAISLDCDVVLDPQTLRVTIARMEADPSLGAVTGFLEILPPGKNENPWHRLLARCEFLEYVTVFGVGRAYQSLMNSVYTLSGAYTVFRREALLSTLMYNRETVSEDTDITFQLYERSPKFKVAILPNTHIYLHPVESLAKLYTQRVRWQRGQLEVSSRHEKLMHRFAGRIDRFTPSRSLIIDHTLSFPRFVWMFFLPVLVAFGYSVSLLVTAYAVLYVFYLVIDLAWYAAAYAYVEKSTRRRMRENILVLLLMPLYRLMIFVFRFSGFLLTLSEPYSWQVPLPGRQIDSGWQALKLRIADFYARLKKKNPTTG